MSSNLKRIGAAVLFVLFGCLTTAFAQTAFEDASGDSSILLKDGGGFVHINVSDTSVKLGFLREHTKSPYYYGLELSGKLNDHFASLFESHKPATEGKITGFLGKKFIFSKKPGPNPTTGNLTDDWLTLRVGYARARYKVLSPGSSFADQVRKQNFDGFSAILAYNALFSSSKGPLLLGLSAGAERRNNIDDLDLVEVNDQIFSSSNGSTQRTVVARQNVYSGTYKESTAAPINTDLVWFPSRFKSFVGMNFFTRSNVGQGDKNFEPGVGLFLMQKDKKGEPVVTHVLGGISVSVRDGKARVGLVAGYHF